MPQVAELSASALGAPKLISFTGSEMLCRPYRFELYFALYQMPNLAAAVASRATLTLLRDEGMPHVFHGILSHVELVQQTSVWGLYRAVLVPKLWQLGLTQHSRVFTKGHGSKGKIPDVIKAILENAGLSAGTDFELKLGSRYGEEELVVQYRESDLEFLHRWMEHEGLYYYFEHGTSQEKMVIVDQKSFHDKLAEKNVRYHPVTGGDSGAGEAFDGFTVLHSAVVGRVKLTDYDYARPMLDVSATESVSSRGYGEHASHGERFFDPGDAKRYAKLRAEAVQAREVLYHASGTALHVQAGWQFELEQHPTDALNKRYLPIEVRHYGYLKGNDDPGTTARWIKPLYDELYRVETTAIDATLQFRPERATRWPRVWGYENGLVDGAAESQYAQIDDQGRYLVKFRFDESDLSGGKASTYVRMIQPHGGTSEGFHFPLRKDTEVVFSFLGGDPDRPVITGVAHNAARPSVVTEQNHTLNIIRTGGGNTLEMDDTEGKQYVWLYTPKEGVLYLGDPFPWEVAGYKGAGSAFVPSGMIMYTDCNSTFHVDGSQWEHVGGTLGVHVVGAVTQGYDTSRKEEVGGTVTEIYVGKHSTKVTNDRESIITGKEDRTVDGAWNLKAKGGGKIDETPTLKADIADSIDMTTKAATFNFTSTADFTFGKTSLTFGSTKVDWGATTGKIESVDISVPSGVKISTPSWDVTNPTESWLGANTSATWANGLEVVGLKTEVTGIKMELDGLAINFTGLKMENNAGKIKQAAMDFRQYGVVQGAQLLRCELAGFFSIV